MWTVVEFTTLLTTIHEPQASADRNRQPG